MKKGRIRKDVAFLCLLKDGLSVFVHIVVIFLIFSRSDAVHPFLIIEIPAHSLLDAFLKLKARFPAEFCLELAAVDGVAHVVAEAVGDEGDELLRLTLGIAEKAVHCLDDDLDEVDVLPLVEAADVVCVGDLSLMEDEVYGARVVFHKQPVADVLALSVYGQRLAVADVVDEEGYQLLGELIGTVVVGAVRHNRRHSVCVVVCAHEVVAAGLGCRIWGMGVVFGRLEEELCAVGHVVFTGGLRSEGSGDAFGMGKLQSAVHLVGGDVVEPFSIKLLRQGLPVFLCGLEECEGAHDVCAGEREGILDGAVHVAFCSEVDYAVDLILPDDASHPVEVCYVGLDEGIVGSVLYVTEVGEVAGIGQLVEVYDTVVGIFVYEEADYMGADESGAACYEDVLHLNDK